MNAQRFGNVGSREWISQEEAVAMVELWGREVMPSSSVRLRDVAETLHISDARAKALLAQVRGESQKAVFTYPLWMSIPFYILLAASLIYSASVIYVLGAAVLRNDKLTGAEGTFLMLSILWVNAWLKIGLEKFAPRLSSFAQKLANIRI